MENIFTQFQEIEKQKEIILNNLYKIVEDLPQNDKISSYQKLPSGGVIYQIKVSELMGNSWHPKYHDFKKTYEDIINIVKRSENPIKVLKNMIYEGKYIVTYKADIGYSPTKVTYPIHKQAQSYLIDKIYPLLVDVSQLKKNILDCLMSSNGLRQNHFTLSLIRREDLANTLETNSERELSNIVDKLTITNMFNIVIKRKLDYI